jgi:adenine-specific DNA glycosylase
MPEYPPALLDAWRTAARQLYREADLSLSEAPCSFTEQNEEICDAEDPQCQPCSLRKATRSYEEAEQIDLARQES